MQPILKTKRAQSLQHPHRKPVRSRFALLSERVAVVAFVSMVPGVVAAQTPAAIPAAPAANPASPAPSAPPAPDTSAHDLALVGITPFVARPQTQSGLLSSSGLALALGANTSLNLMLGATTRQADGLDLTLNGLRFNNQFGQSSRSKYSGLAYFSDLQRASSDVALTWKDTFNNPLKSKALVPNSALLGDSYLLAQSLDMHSGGLRLSAQFQDVSKKFAGFANLKLNAAGDKATLDQLAQLEKEKGLQRVGLGLGLGGSLSGKRPGGLSLEWEQISDHGDAKKPLQALALGANFPQKKLVGAALPALHREFLGFDTGQLNFSVTHRAIDSGFKRLGDLSDADKNTYLLDIRRQFDLTAKIEQVTQAERDQAGKTAAFAPDVTLARVVLGGSERNGVVTFGQYAIGDKPITPPTTTVGTAAAPAGAASTLPSGSAPAAPASTSGAALGAKSLLAGVQSNSQTKNLLQDLFGAEQNQGIARQMFGFTNAHLQFSYSTQTILDSFTHLGELADVDKARFGKEAGLKHDQMALQWQFDKTTKFGFERMQIVGSGDAIRDAVAQALKDGKDPVAAQRAAASAANRESFHFEAKGLNLIANEAQTDKTFTRAADLALPDADKQQIERERGFARKDLTLHLSAIKDLLVDSYTYKAENAVDKVRHDISKNSFLFTPLKSLSFNYAEDHDTTITANKAGDKGGPLQSGTTHTLFAFKGLLPLMPPSADTRLTPISAKSAPLTTSSTMATPLPTIAPIAIALGNNKRQEIPFSAQREETVTLDKSKQTQSVIADVLNLGMPKDKVGAGLDYSDKRIAFQNGKYDNTVEFNIHAKPTTNLSLQIDKRDSDRRVDDATTKLEDKKDGLVSTESVELDYKPIKNFDIILGGSQTTVPDAPKIVSAETRTVGEEDAKTNVKPLLGMTDSDTVSVGLKGEPVKNITLAARFDEVHDDGKNTKDVADFSMSNAKPLHLGVFQEVTIKAGYASLNDKRLLQNETMTGHAAWKMWKHEFLLDYGGFAKMDGKALDETVSRTYSFKTDPSPQRWFHGSFFYKVRTLVDGKDRLVRRFSADALVLKKTRLAYTFGTLPENEKGDMQPLETLDVSLIHTLQPRATLSLFYRINNKQPSLLGKPDPLAVTWTNSAGVGLEEPIGAKSKWGAALSRDSNGYGLYHDHSDHLRLSLDRQVSPDNFLTLSTDYRTHDGKNTEGKTLHDEVRASLDLSHKF